jgi:hypothetical protein
VTGVPPRPRWSSPASASSSLANGFRCPLTRLAEAAGAASGSVTDIYLPTWFARNLPAIHVPLLVLIGWLHGRTLSSRRTSRRPAATGPQRP